MNFLMIMGFIGLFTLTMTAAPPVLPSFEGPSEFEQRSLQTQVNQITKHFIELQTRQNELMADQAKFNCRLGAIETNADSPFRIIDAPEGLYMQMNDGTRHLLEKKVNKNPVADILTDKKESSEAKEALNKDKTAETKTADHKKTQKSDIFIETSMSPEDLKKAAAKADAKAEAAKVEVTKHINKGNERIENIECKNDSDRGCEARLDNHRPIQKDNLKEYTTIKKEGEESNYYSDTLDDEYKRAMERTSYNL